MEGCRYSRLFAVSVASVVLLIGSNPLHLDSRCVENDSPPSFTLADPSEAQWIRELAVRLGDVADDQSHLDADTIRLKAYDVAKDLGLMDAGGSVGNPLLVWDMSFRPSYFIVPLEDSRGLTLLGLNGSTGAWQWYSHSAEDFPRVQRDEAEALVLSLEGDLDPELEPFVITTPLKKLFWVLKTASSYFLINIDDPEDVLVASQHTDSILMSGSPSPTTSPRGPRPASDIPPDVPQSHNINVPFYYQETSWYCGEAALQMVFDYYGPLISQDDIGDVANEEPFYGTYADDVRRAAHFSYMSTAIQNESLHGYEERKLGYAAFEEFWSFPNETLDPDFPTRYADLKDLIDGDNPLILTTWYDVSHTVGHFRVLKGYDDTTNEFIVHDPWFGVPYGGPNVHFNETFLVDDLWTDWYRHAIFISPWVVDLFYPASVMQGEIFDLFAYVEYKAPHPFEWGYDAADSTAILGLPEGGETAYGYDVEQPLAITWPGTWDAVLWPVFSRKAGTFNFTVNASGTVWGDTWYSYPFYEDRIGNIVSGSTVVVADSVVPSITILTPTDGATVNRSKVWVSWTGSDNVRIDRYELRVDSGPWTDVGTETDYNITGLDRGWHTVEVVAYDPAGNNATDSVSFNFTYRPPGPPTNLAAELSGVLFQNVTISWDLSSDDGQSYDHVIGYRVYRDSWFNEDGTGYSVIGSVPRGTATFEDVNSGHGDPWQYFYRVCALDTNGTCIFASDQVGKFTRPLDSGPELVSIPLVPTDNSPEAVLQTVQFDRAWSYDAVGKRWRTFASFKPYGGDLEDIDQTMGMWVNVTTASQLTVTGLVPVQTTIHLHKGWNLVGFPSVRWPYEIAELRANVEVEKVEGLDRTTPPNFLKILQDSDVIWAGEAIWVLVSQHVTWTVSFV